MKTLRNITFLLVLCLLAGCGGKKSEKITKADLIGRWQPEKIEFRDIPLLLKSQISTEDIEKDVLSNAQKKGYLELREDGTFAFKDTPSDKEHTGKWSFDGDKAIKIDLAELELTAGNKLLNIGFNVESVSKDKLEIDYASMYKVMAGIEKVPFFDMKLVMCYKRVE